MSLHAYRDFLASKLVVDQPTGMSVLPDLPDCLFLHQRDIVRWSLRRGRAAVFAGTGLGKTLIELAWGQAVASVTGGMVLLFAPLAVAPQIIRDAAKFGIPCRQVTCQEECGPGINITNYHKLPHFDLSLFVAVILDESSILKNYAGHYRNELVDAVKSVPFRLAATATPAPNDFMELGNHAEFLGVMPYFSMLATFFTHDGSDTRVWRLKGHAEADFWRWMASWAVMLRKPSDLGYADDGYDLPPLTKRLHVVETGSHWDADGLYSMLPIQARTMSERSAARRDSLAARVARAIEITPSDAPYVWWCNLNAESEALARGIEGAVEVSGADSDTAKERKLLDFSEGRIRVLVTKPSIAGFGMNWQHCWRTGVVGLNDSFERLYQLLRRFWRFGQTREVLADFIAADTEGNVIANQERKEADAERMAAAMVAHMADLSSSEVRGAAAERFDYTPKQRFVLPAWEEFA